MTTPLDQAMAAAGNIYRERIEHHLKTPEVSFADHVRTTREARAKQIEGKKIVFLDTNAWNVLIDVRRGKPNVDLLKRELAEQVWRALDKGRVVFPIAISTLNELDSRTDAQDHAAVDAIIDEVTGGIAFAKYLDKINEDLGRLARNDFSSDHSRSAYLRSPAELLDLPVPPIPEARHAKVDENTHHKAHYDDRGNVPASLVFKGIRDYGRELWSDKATIADFNKLLPELKSKVPTAPNQTPQQKFVLVTYYVLRGVLQDYCAKHALTLSEAEIKDRSLRAALLWNDTPSNTAFASIRVQVSLHALLIADAGRKFQKGDTSDFASGVNALPVADAFYTDHAMKALLGDSRLQGLKAAMPCIVVSGFQEMKDHLAGLMS
jgi:hypothetical protein